MLVKSSTENACITDDKKVTVTAAKLCFDSMSLTVPFAMHISSVPDFLKKFFILMIFSSDSKSTMDK